MWVACFFVAHTLHSWHLHCMICTGFVAMFLQQTDVAKFVLSNSTVSVTPQLSQQQQASYPGVLVISTKILSKETSDKQG
jgi:hypothetical protein